jgi:hypothetical protein
MFRCGAHLPNLALSSCKMFPRSIGVETVLEELWFKVKTVFKGVSDANQEAAGRVWRMARAGVQGCMRQTLEDRAPDASGARQTHSREPSIGPCHRTRRPIERRTRLPPPTASWSFEICTCQTRPGASTRCIWHMRISWTVGVTIGFLPWAINTTLPPPFKLSCPLVQLNKHLVSARESKSLLEFKWFENCKIKDFISALRVASVHPLFSLDLSWSSESSGFLLLVITIT